MGSQSDKPFSTASPIAQNFDAVDFVTGIGLKKFYLAAANDSVGVKDFLTVDSTLVSDDAIAAHQVITNATDRDFDITFENAAFVANSACTISYTVFGGSGGNTFTPTWIIYHVRGGTETSMGTVIDATTSGDNGKFFRRTVKFVLDATSFAVGDILRVNVVIASNDAAPYFFVDPSGHVTKTSSVADGSINSSCEVDIPFRLE